MPSRVRFRHSLIASPPAGSNRAFAHSSPRPQEKTMRVDPKDGTCRSCRGTLTIIDADDATMTVECDEWT